jgi:hypothetical protein
VAAPVAVPVPATPVASRLSPAGRSPAHTIVVPATAPANFDAAAKLDRSLEAPISNVGSVPSPAVYDSVIVTTTMTTRGTSALPKML